jgi:hypothetical protein
VADTPTDAGAVNRPASDGRPAGDALRAAPRPDGKLARRVLVIGPERSGTTWIATALSRGLGALYVHEPDSPGINPGARHEPLLTRYPVLDRGDNRAELADYIALWDLAFSGAWPLRPVPPRVVDAFSSLPSRVEAPLTRGARSVLQRARALKVRLAPSGWSTRGPGRSPGTEGRPVLAKSVYAMFALEWLVDRYQPDAVIVVLREAVTIAESMVRMGTGSDRIGKLRHAYEHPLNQREFVVPLGLPTLPDDLGVVEACAWWAAFTTTVLRQTAARHPEWTVLHHESLLDRPRRALAAVSAALGRCDDTALEEYLAGSERPGRGYSTKRVAAELRRGESALPPGEGQRIRAVIERFPADPSTPQ